MTCGICGQELLPGSTAHVDLFDNAICGPCYAVAMEADGIAVEVDDELDREERAQRRDEEYRRLFDDDDGA